MVGFDFEGKAVIDGETLSAQLRCEQFNMAIHFLGYSIIFVFFSLMSLYAWKCTKELFNLKLFCYPKFYVRSSNNNIHLDGQFLLDLYFRSF